MDTAHFLGMLVVALGSLFGFFWALARPLISGVTELTKSITSLNESVKGLKDDMQQIKDDLKEETEHASLSRKRLWDHNDEQDRKIENHEKRIYHMELKNGVSHEEKN